MDIGCADVRFLKVDKWILAVQILRALAIHSNSVDPAPFL
jgi:hypothetical protein